MTNIVGIAAGLDFSMALRADGRIIAWGARSHFFDGTLSVPTGLVNAVLIAAGPSHVLAVTGVPLAERPVLQIARSGDALVVTWPLTAAANFDLEAADNLAGPFALLNVPLQTNDGLQTISAVVPLTPQNLLLRLRGH